MSSHQGAGVGAQATATNTWKVPHTPIAHFARNSGCELNELIRLVITLGQDIYLWGQDPSP